MACTCGKALFQRVPTTEIRSQVNLIVRSPQALKLLLWFLFQQPRLVTSTISVAIYESSALRPQISARIDKPAAGRKTVW
jgi:hypothetical protein